MSTIPQRQFQWTFLSLYFFRNHHWTSIFFLIFIIIIYFSIFVIIYILKVHSKWHLKQSTASSSSWISIKFLFRDYLFSKIIIIENIKKRVFINNCLIGLVQFLWGIEVIKFGDLHLLLTISPYLLVGLKLVGYDYLSIYSFLVNFWFILIY